MTFSQELDEILTQLSLEGLADGSTGGTGSAMVDSVNDARAATLRLISEELIGEDEIGFKKYGSMCDHSQHLEIKHFNQLRAEQRKRLHEGSEK